MVGKLSNRLPNKKRASGMTIQELLHNAEHYEEFFDEAESPLLPIEMLGRAQESFFMIGQYQPIATRPHQLSSHQTLPGDTHSSRDYGSAKYARMKSSSGGFQSAASVKIGGLHINKDLSSVVT